MARTRFTKTGLTLSNHVGDERELSLVVGYEFTPAFNGSRDEPGHDASVEITSVALSTLGGDSLSTPEWLQNWVQFDQSLIENLAAEAIDQDASDRAEAEERRAEDRAERLREEA